MRLESNLRERILLHGRPRLWGGKEISHCGSGGVTDNPNTVEAIFSHNRDRLIGIGPVNPEVEMKVEIVSQAPYPPNRFNTNGSQVDRCDLLCPGTGDQRLIAACRREWQCPSLIVLDRHPRSQRRSAIHKPILDDWLPGTDDDPLGWPQVAVDAKGIAAIHLVVAKIAQQRWPTHNCHPLFMRRRVTSPALRANRFRAGATESLVAERWG